MRHLGISIALLAVVGCNAHDAADLKRDVSNVAQTASRAAVNGQLAARVNATLAQRKGVDVSGLHVEAEKGVVTLGGHVRTLSEKKTVLETVNGIRGVDKVVDKLRVEAK